MRAYEFLIEYNEQSLVNLLGTKVLAKWKVEGEPFKDEMNPSGEVTPADILKWISQYDPTRNGSYVKWLAQIYTKNDGIRKLEDIPSRAHDLLIRYEELKKSRKLIPPDNNINQIKTLGQLHDIIDKHKEEDTTSNKKQKQELKNKLYQAGDIEVLYNGPDYLIAIPHTKEASCYLGKNTQWCTAAKNNNLFDKYNKDGDLYVILDKKNNKRWQFQFESAQYTNEEDRSINIDAFIKTHKKVVNIILKHYGGLEKAAIVDPMNWIAYIKNPSEEAQLAAVKYTGYPIQYIKNPTETMQLAAVKRSSRALKYIISIGINPSEAVKLVAVKFIGNIISYIKNPSEEVQLAAVKEHGYALQYIKNPSEAVQLAAVKRTGYALLYIKNPSEAMQLLAVKRSSKALKYIIHIGINPSAAVKLASVKYIGNTILYIENPSEEMQLLAVKQNGRALRYIIKKGIIPSEAVQLAAVMKEHDAIKYIIKAGITPSEAVQQAANM